MEDYKEHIYIIAGIITLVIMFFGGIMFYVVYKLDQNQKYQCSLLGISEQDCNNRMTVGCANDCRLLTYREFKWTSGGFGKSSCTCLDHENKPVLIW